jgi:hypothetical protein
MATAVRPPERPATVSSWPAVAVDTSNSEASSGRIGASVRKAACAANRHANRTGAGPRARAARAGAGPR